MPHASLSEKLKVPGKTIAKRLSAKCVTVDGEQVQRLVILFLVTTGPNGKFQVRTCRYKWEIPSQNMQVQVVDQTTHPPKCHHFVGLDRQIGSSPPAEEEKEEAEETI